MTKCIYCGLCQEGLPGRCDRRRAEHGILGRDARGAHLRQAEAAG
jgi:formate hydrogenlyase subunit 6/NADH:ubiquinone oxidoreductase subunit I